MNKTWIVSGPDSLAKLKAFCFGNLAFQFLIYNQIERLHPFALEALPDTVVLDAESVPQWSSFVATHATVNPSIPRTLLVLPNSQILPHSCFVDNVIQLPADTNEIGAVVAQLIARASAAASLREIRSRLRVGMDESQIIGKSMQTSRVLEKLPSVAANESTVLITGETGVGKELIARALQRLQQQRFLCLS